MPDKKSILEMCLDLHMHNTGASDPLPPATYGEYFHYLCNKVQAWLPSHDGTKQFDDAVLNLVKVTIAECSEHRNVK